MWTPRRVILLAVGYFLVVASYLGYLGSTFGAIDGLPALPELMYPSQDPTDRVIPTARCTIRRVEERIKQAFGADCPELKWPIQLEVNNKTLAVAAEDFKIEDDGRLCLMPASVAVFPRDFPAPGTFPEINTLRGQVAYIKFDRPISNLSEINGRKIVGAEISGNIRVTNNRKTPDPTDDLVMHIGTGPLYYLESTHLIWTHDTVHIQDFQSKPKPMDVWGKGMEIELVSDPATGPGARPAPPTRRGTNTGDKITGVKRAVLQSNVDMTFYVDGNSGFPGGSHDTYKVPEVPTPLLAQPPAPEKAQVTIKTSGRFRYDFLKEYDVARFETPALDPRQPVRAPQHVVVERFFPSTNNYDHLFCATLELHLKKRDNKTDQPRPPAPPAGQQQVTERNMDIIYARAQGPLVTLTSDSEKLDAMGVDLIYDARTLKTTLRGEPEMIATKDRNRIYARVLEMTEHRTPDQHSYQTAVATGPGHVDVLDEKNKEKITAQAFWNEKLTTSRDGDFDLLVLTGAGKFIDREADQMLKGETLKVWLTRGEDAPAPKTPNVAEVSPSNAQQGGRRVHLLEALGDVSTRSKDLNIHNTSRLIVRFRDVPVTTPLPGGGSTSPGTPAPGNAPSTPGSSVMVPPPVSAPSETSARKPTDAAPVPTPKPMGTTGPASATAAGSAPVAPAKPEEPRPLFLSARNVEAWVVRAGPKSSVERVWCEGTVDVKQAPATPEEKGLSVNGDTLAMDCFVEGNVLEVTGDLAQLRMDRLYILGPVVNIDQPRNRAWVTGAGAMQIESKTNFNGETLKKAVPTTILWKKDMLFTGLTAEFKESIQAEQENALMACNALQVFFDREIKLRPESRPVSTPKPGQAAKQEDPARIKNMVCDGNVRIDETTYDKQVIIKYQRIESGHVRLEVLDPDDDGPNGPGRKAEEKPADENVVRGSGEGTLRLFQVGGTDPLAPPTPQPMNQPMNQPMGTAPKKETKDEGPKLTFIQYRNSMYANSKKNLASFWGQVRVVNLPSKDPMREIDLEKLIADLPMDALYIASDQLTVLNRGTKERSQQEMQAKGRVMVKAKEFWGRAEMVSFNEAKDQVILDGGEDGLATLFKDIGRGAPPQKIEGKKITYIRTSGAFKVDEGRWISGE
jgi:hypothetical protein